MKRKTKPSPSLFTTTDFFGNLVDLPRDRWERHIVVEHPDMLGYETLVQSVVEAPAEIRVSLYDKTGLAFISEPGVGPRPEGIRVLVNYADTHYEKGSSCGMVSTAYPIDILKYPHPSLGKRIYKKGGQK